MDFQELVASRRHGKIRATLSLREEFIMHGLKVSLAAALQETAGVVTIFVDAGVQDPDRRRTRRGAYPAAFTRRR
jgi:hypothetical protein